MTQTQVRSVREKSKENKACAQMLHLNFHLYQSALCCRQLVGLTSEISFRFCFAVFARLLHSVSATNYMLFASRSYVPNPFPTVHIKKTHFSVTFSQHERNFLEVWPFFRVGKGTSSTAGGKTHVNLDRWNLFCSFSFLFFNSSSLHLPLFSWSITYACGKVCGCWQKDKSARSFPFLPCLQ